MNKTYQEYNWLGLIEHGKLGKLVVKELEKYLKHHGLDLRGTKKDKVKAIMCHVLQTNENIDLPDEPDSTSESEEEIVAAVLPGRESESETELDDETSESHSESYESDSSEAEKTLSRTTCVTRSGQQAKKFTLTKL